MVKDIITIYWAQVTLVLGSFGYILKIILDYLTKKREINHSIFTNKKIECLSRFFLNYSKVKEMYFHLKIYQVLRKEISATDLDDYVFPPIDELRRSVIEIQLYFDKNIHSKFEDILKNVELINKRLSDLYFEMRSESLTVTQKVVEFDIYREKLLKDSDDLIKDIVIFLKKVFNS